MLHRKKVKAEVFKWGKSQEADPLERLRYAAACKLCIWHQHQAGGGSSYITIGGVTEADADFDSLKLRFADHDQTSAKFSCPDFNFVNRVPTEDDIQSIVKLINYPTLCKRSAFAKHVGLTVPKLKKLLKPDCYEGVCENESYPNTLTEYVVVAIALSMLEKIGVKERIAVQQQLITFEDYPGF